MIRLCTDMNYQLSAVIKAVAYKLSGIKGGLGGKQGAAN